MQAASRGARPARNPPSNRRRHRRFMRAAGVTWVHGRLGMDVIIAWKERETEQNTPKRNETERKRGRKRDGERGFVGRGARRNAHPREPGCAIREAPESRFWACQSAPQKADGSLWRCLFLQQSRAASRNRIVQTASGRDASNDVSHSDDKVFQAHPERALSYP